MILGLDTETLDGYAKLLAIESRGCFIINNIDEALELLMYDPEHVAFNLDYDAIAILKYLPFRQARMLSLGYAVEYNDYKIKYLPRKKLTITRGHKSIKIYDAYQFFLMSLDAAAKKYLGKSKSEGISGADINEDNIYNPETRKYCYNDACLAGELMRFFSAGLPDEIKRTKPVSCATLSYNYFKPELQSNSIPHDVNYTFQQSFRGGRFEVFQRGYFENVFYADINSAYPYALSQAPSLNGAAYFEHPIYHPTEDYGVYCVDVYVPEKYISPVMMKRQNKIFCPVGELRNVWITSFEMAQLDDIQEAKVDIKYAFHIYANREHRPFAEKINFLYPRKKENISYKTILNSLFGKTAQTIEKYTVAQGACNGEDIQIENDTVYRWYSDTRISNFVLANYITAFCRNMLYNAMRPIYRDIIACFTDCIISTREIPHITYGNALGQWKAEKWEKLWMIGSGVYFWQKDGKIDGRFRGFDINNSEEILDKILHSRGTKINIPVTRRVSLIESINQSYYECANQIYDDLKIIDLNFDQKRVWMDRFRRGPDIEKMQIRSLAIPLI